ncbi:MAG: hypothetical protein RLZZ210_1025 [Pseudomonadota bacterium]|jgi:hypothetical protein
MDFVDTDIKPKLKIIYKNIFNTTKSPTLKDGLGYVMYLTGKTLSIYDSKTGIPINL